MNGDPIYFARIIGIEVRPELSDSVIEIYRTTSLPMIVNDPGLVAALGLVNRSSGSACSITVWETPDDRERSGILAPGAPDNLANYANLMTGAYTRDSYEVTFFALDAPGPQGSFLPAVARITTEDIRPGRWNDGAAALRTFARHSNTEHPDVHGAMVLESRSTYRALLIEVARSRSGLEANVTRMLEHEIEGRRSGYLTSILDREVYEVIARY